MAGDNGAARLLERVDALDAMDRSGQAGAAVARARELLARAGDAPSAEDAVAHANALNRLGMFFFYRGFAAEALRAYELAHALVERHAPDDAGSLATLHNNLGQALEHLGRLEDARRHLQAALALRERPGAPELETGFTQDNLARVLARLGETERALTLHEVALGTFERLQGDFHEDVATALGNLGALHAQLGDARRARACYLRALDTHLMVGGLDSNGTVTCATNLLRQALREHDDELGGELCEVLLAVGGETPGVAQHATGVALLQAAENAFHAFSLALAERLARRANQLLEAAAGRYASRTQQAVRLLAVILAAKGNLGAAEQWQMLLLDAPGRSAEAQAKDWIEFAKSMRSRGRASLPQAVALFERALALIRAQPEPDADLLASALGNLAQAHFMADRFDDAERCYREAMAALAGDPAAHDRPWLEHGQAMLLYERGRHDEALALYRRARGRWVRRLGSRHPFVATTDANIALLQWDRGDAAGAARAFGRAARVRAPEVARQLAVGSEGERLQAARAALLDLYRAVSFHFDTGAAGMLAATLAVQRKGAVQLAMAQAQARLRRSLDVPNRQRLERLIELQRAITEQVAAEPLYGGVDDPRMVDRLQNEAAQLQSELGHRSAFGQAALQPPTLAQVRAALPARGVLVEYLHWPVYRARQREAVGTRYAALVLRRRGTPAWFDLGPADAIDAAVHRLRRQLADAALPDPTRALRALEQLVLAPLDEAIDGAAELIVAPDAALNLVPFAVLGRPMLGDRCQLIQRAGGAEGLVVDAQAPPTGAPVAVVDPDFGTGDAGFAALPGTRAEGQLLRQLWPELQLISGADASVEALRRVERPRLLHIASHGHFEAPAKPRVAWTSDLVGTDDGLLIVQRSGPSARDDAMWHAGLALAGANAGAQGRAPGIASAAELAQLDLRGTELVTLSACDTGLGSAAQGAEFAGLRRAFMVAGSRSQLTSLWAVDDEACAALMTALYRALRAGAGKAEALQRARRAVRERPRWEHPSYWAAFVLWGDGGPLVGGRTP